MGTHTYSYTHTCVHMDIYMQLCTHRDVCTCMEAPMQLHTYTYAHACECAHAHTHVLAQLKPQNHRVPAVQLVSLHLSEKSLQAPRLLAPDGWGEAPGSPRK